MSYRLLLEVTTDQNQVDMYFQLKDTGGKPGSYKLESTPESVRVEATDYSGFISAITTIRQLLPATIEVQGGKTNLFDSCRANRRCPPF